MTPRIEGWEARVLAVIEKYRRKPYRLGRSDCLTFACAAVEAMTGIDYMDIVPRRYATNKAALKLAREMGGGSVADAVTAKTGFKPCSVASAGRGDVCLYVDDIGEHLGVFWGRFAYVYGPLGVVTVDINKCASGWRV